MKATRLAGTCVLLLAHAAGLSGAGAHAIAGELPVFRETPCNLPGLNTELANRVRCGTVDVPRVYSGSARGSLALFVVIVRSPRQPAEPDPIVILSGGPGESATQMAALVGPDIQSWPIRPRDVIFIDQRGTGQSEPPGCRQTPSTALTPFAADLTTEQLVSTIHAQMRDCLTGLTKQGVPPEAWGTQVTAQDFERVRMALGVARWNALSVSYGTSLGMTLAARYPETLRLLVLDSVLVPDPLPVEPRVAYLLSRDALFSLCARDAACAKAYPVLPELYARAVSRLEAAPIVIPMSEHLGLPGNRFVLNRGDFEFLMHQALYFRDAYPKIPSLIRAAAEGRGGDFGPMIERITPMFANLSPAAYAAVSCRDNPRNQTARFALFGFDIGHLGGVCPQWAKPGPLPQVPVGTPVPMLIFAGTLDPVTPYVNGILTARQVGRSARLVQMREFGHAPFASPAMKAGAEECGERIVASFLNDPAQPPDMACADAPAPIVFE
jgi:pimeloyl-ACP methyl ester carboxylesterase